MAELSGCATPEQQKEVLEGLASLTSTINRLSENFICLRERLDFVCQSIRRGTMCNQLKILKFIWVCLVIILVSFFVVSMLVNTIVVWQTSGGTRISLDGGGLAGAILACVVYYLSKLLINKVE